MRIVKIKRSLCFIALRSIFSFAFGQLFQAEGHNHNIIIIWEKYVFLLTEPIVFWFMIFTLVFIHWNHSTLRTVSEFRVQWSFEFSSSHKVNLCHYLNQKTVYRHHRNQFHQFIDFAFNLHDWRNHDKCIVFVHFYFSIEINIRLMIYEKLPFITRAWLLCNFCIIIWFSFLFWNWIVAINTFSTRKGQIHA